jgi:hypothetical protein
MAASPARQGLWAAKTCRDRNRLGETLGAATLRGRCRNQEDRAPAQTRSFPNATQVPGLELAQRVAQLVHLRVPTSPAADGRGDSATGAFQGVAQGVAPARDPPFGFQKGCFRAGTVTAKR